MRHSPQISSAALLAALVLPSCVVEQKAEPSPASRTIQDPLYAARLATYHELREQFRASNASTAARSPEVSRKIIVPYLEAAFALRQWEEVRTVYLSSLIDESLPAGTRARCAALTGEAQLLADWDRTAVPEQHFRVALEILNSAPTSDADFTVRRFVEQRLGLLELSGSVSDSERGFSAARMLMGDVNAELKALSFLIQAENLIDIKGQRGAHEAIEVAATVIKQNDLPLKERLLDDRAALASALGESLKAVEAIRDRISLASDRLQRHNYGYLAPLYCRLGTALSAAGRDVDAANAFTRAAELAERQFGADNRWVLAAREGLELINKR